MNSKPAARSARKKWKTHPPALYADLIGYIGHFSAKTLNSNVGAMGVRIGAADLLDLPYVAVSTMETTEAVPLDYLRNAADSAVFNQMMAARAGTHLQLYETAPQEEVDQIRSLLGALDEAGVVGEGSLNPRLRQILWPDADGGYTAITPLQSAGFSATLEVRLAAEREEASGAASRPPVRRRAILGIGGSKPHNVGAYAWRMGRPLVFESPRENPSLRRCLAVHHRGMDLPVPIQGLDAFAAWRHQWKLNGRATDAATREREARLIVELARDTLAAAAKVEAELREHLEELGTVTSDAVAPFERGLVEAGQRDREWPKQFASRMIRRIASHEYEWEGKRYTVASDADLAHLETAMQEVASR